MTIIPWIADFLVRLTIVLAVGWLAFWSVSKRNPRWAVIVIRTMIVASLGLPFLYAYCPSARLAILPAPASGRSPSSSVSTGAALPKAPLISTTEEPAAPMARTADSPKRRSPDIPELKSDSRHPGEGPAIVTAAAQPKSDSRPNASAKTKELAGSADFHVDMPATRWLLMVWVAGSLALVTRLGVRLKRTQDLLRAASEPSAELLLEFRHLAQRQGLRWTPRLRISANISGPCTAGWPTAVVLIPDAWPADLSDRERQAVLVHELSHVVGRDMFWDVIIQLAGAIWWFHPFAWRLASVHRLACEHACDAEAAEWAGGFFLYRRMLARWALRHRGPEGAAAAIAMADRSLLMRRLRWLEAPRRFAALGRRSQVAFVAVAALVSGIAASVQLMPTARAQTPASAHSGETASETVAADGGTVSQGSVPAAKDIRPAAVRRPGVADIDTSQTRPKTVRVVDEQDQPIAGATVRVGWWEDADDDMLGRIDPDPPVTNDAGEATISVPLGAVRAQISAAAQGYVDAGGQYSLSGQPTLTLRPGRVVRVHAVTPEGQPLPEAVPMLEDSRVWPREFKPIADRPGYFESPIVGLERRWMRVVDGSSDGPLKFSELIDVSNPRSIDDGSIVAVLRPGIRLEGRLDDSVPRPIKTGFVELYIRESEGHRIPHRDKDDNLLRASGWSWQDTARIEEDGTFQFESLPAGGHVQLFALVDGYQSAKPSANALRAYLEAHNAGDVALVDRAAERNDAFWPHLFPLPAGQQSVQVELPCTPTSSLDVSVVDPLGRPIEGAHVRFNPNGYFLGGELFIPCTGRFMEASRVRPPSQEISAAMREFAHSTFLDVTSGPDGVAHVRNLPGDGLQSYRVEAQGFVMPIHPTSTDRDARYTLVELAGGKTVRQTVTLETFVPRTSRAIIVVDRQGQPVPKIKITATDLTFETAPDDWELWAIQRFGPIASAETDDEGIVRLDVPAQVHERQVARVRIVVEGRFMRDAYVQRERLDIPLEADGRVVVLTASDDAPADRNAFRAVDVAYVEPGTLLDHSPAELLERLVASPSLVLLKQLLDAAQFDAATPLGFRPDRNLLRRKPPSPLAVVPTEQGDRVVVLCDVKPKDATWRVKPEGRFAPEAALVFDHSDGKLIAMLGGWASASGDYSSVMLTNLGGTDDYFVNTSAFEEHGPFKYLEQWYHLGHEDRPALTTHGHANATGWSGKESPAVPLAEFGYSIYAFNGRDINYSLPGHLPNGTLAPRKIFWDGVRNTFIGPVTQSFDGESLYRVVAEKSGAFQPLVVQPGDIVVAGGRREYENWHQWDVVVPQGRVGSLRLILVDRSGDQAAETELASAQLSEGLHDLQLQIRDADNGDEHSTVEIRIDPDNLAGQPTLTVPRVPVAGAPSVEGQPIARTSRSPVDLLHRQTSKGGVWLVWQLAHP